MFTERTSVGLDVHARSVAAAAIDAVTGELVRAKLTPSHEHIRSWLGGLPGPVAVAYEAGPTGFGLCRALRANGIRCEVIAASKVARPAGDRVKTDAKDAMLLARLLRLDELTSVSVPTAEQEAARDLVRAREDCRTDLMRARNRLSKLLLRHGIVYSDGAAWTDKHQRWLRRDAFGQLAMGATRSVFDADYETVLVVTARRDRLDTQIEAMAADCEFAPLVRRLCCLRGISTLTGFALAVEIGDWTRFTGASIGAFIGLGAHRTLLRGITRTRANHQDRQRPRPAVARRGRLAPPHPLRDRQDNARPLEPGTRRCAGPRGRREPAAPPTLGQVHRPQETTQHRQHRDRPRARRLVLVTGRLRRTRSDQLTHKHFAKDETR